MKRADLVERIQGDSLPLNLLCHESWIFVEEKPDREKTKTKKANYVDEECLESFMTEVPITQKPFHRFEELINGLVSMQQEPQEICEMFVYKHLETVEYVKNYSTF